MRVCTLQAPDYDIRRDKRDLRKSNYYNDPAHWRIRSAYDKLHKRLGTDQIIWCYAQRNETLSAERPQTKFWELEVPDDEIITFVDTYVWERVIGNNIIPESLKTRWRDKARETSGDLDWIDQVIKQKQDEFAIGYPEDRLWNLLLHRVQEKAWFDPLIPNPIRTEWVISERYCQLCIPFHF